MELDRLLRQVTQRLPVVRRRNYDEHVRQFGTWFPVGHFYSPYPDLDEIERKSTTLLNPSRPISGVDLGEARQLDLLRQLAAQDGASLPFPVTPQCEFRYHFDNDSYAWGDGIILNAMLRHIRPSRIIEVGSGYSSAMVLDTVDRWLISDGHPVDVTFIEPFPDLLHSLLRPEDRRRVDVLEMPVQDADSGLFERLAPGDLLIIDSTHVSKMGSDVNHLFFDVIPQLAVGVWVHIHDVFMPFEYPLEWVRQGRAWQETYLLRSFLMFNSAFSVRWFQDFMWHSHRDELTHRWPEMERGPGGTLWIQREA
jgi:hypothetical protein